MKNITVTIISDSMDCETCGSSWASGYTIEADGKMEIDKTPCANCYGESDYGSDPYPDLADFLKLHLYDQFPESLYFEKAVGYSDDIADENYDEEWAKWNERNQAYPGLIETFLGQQNIELTILHEDIGYRWEDDDDFND